MTEAEARSELLCVKDRVSERKIRLFACACCRRAWDWLDDESRSLVLLGERLADGLATNVERRAASKKASERVGSYVTSHPANYAFCGITSLAWHGADLAICHLPSKITGVTLRRASGEIRDSKECRIEQEHQQKLLRDIVGHLFVSVSVNSAWLTPTVVSIARSIYTNHAFDRMPILADALQDAGCTHYDVLSHCRDTKTPHARGCWVVDLILGKS